MTRCASRAPTLRCASLVARCRTRVRVEVGGAFLVGVRDRGSGGVVTVLVGVGLTAAVLMAAVPFGRGLVDHERARTAADAAALAGVTGGRAAAARIASTNGGVLVAWAQDGDEVSVTVRVEGRRATARATNGP